MSTAKDATKPSFRKFLFLLTIITLALSACSTAGWIPGMKSDDAEPLQKRVMVSPIIDLAGAGKERCARIDARLFELLERSPRLVLYKAPHDATSTSQLRAPQFGIVSQPELVKRAEERGMNALVTGTLNAAEISTQNKGIWPFRNKMRTYVISMVINVVDLSRGCLYLTRLDSQEVDYLLDEVEGLDEQQVMAEALEKAALPILVRQVEAVTKRLVEEPWAGKILSAGEGSVTINAGEDVGVRPGLMFTVYAQGEPILCQNGQKMDLLGGKVAEIKTTSVMKNRASAVLVNGGPVADGQVIRLVR